MRPNKVGLDVPPPRASHTRARTELQTSLEACPIGPRRYPWADVHREPGQNIINTRGSSALLRALGGLPDPPGLLAAERQGLLVTLLRRASSLAHGPAEVSAVLVARGRSDVAGLVRRWASVRGGRARLGAEAHYASERGPQGILTARLIGWAIRRL